MRTSDRRLAAFTLFACVIFVACLDTSPSAPLDSLGGAASTADVYDDHHFPTLDDWLEQLGRTVPGGFAGIYRDRDYRIVVALTDTSQATRALRAVRQALGAKHQKVELTVRQADFTFLQLRTWSRELPGDVFAIPGVKLFDIAEDVNRIVIGVIDESAVPAVRQLVLHRGVPQSAVVTRVVGQVVKDQTLQDQFRPVPAGVEVTQAICTLGYNVFHYVHGRTFTTASHCTSVEFGLDGDTIPQPSNGTAIGVEVMDPPPYTGGDCPGGRRCRRSDASLARYDSNVQYELGMIARPLAVGSITIDPDNPRFMIERTCMYGWPDCLVVGDSIYKIGRTTGWTTGVITGGCVDITEDGGVLLRCQMVGNYLSGNGDSGAPVMGPEVGWGDGWALGVHWGRNLQTGDRYFSSLIGVRQEFGNGVESECFGLRISQPFSFWC